MAEHRKFCTSICVKNIATSAEYNAKLTTKIEIFPAEQWEDGQEGTVRVRVNRSWAIVDRKKYLTPAELAQFVSRFTPYPVDQEEEAVSSCPYIPRGTIVSALNGREQLGMPLREQTRTATHPPILGHDGHWYVGVLLHGKGIDMAPVDSLIF